MKSPVTLLEVIRFECLHDILCARCQNALERHQPDGERPDQMLGTCNDCGTWYLIDSEGAVMFTLPDVASLRND